MAAWHGVVVASALPFHDDLSVDYESFADHVRWLAENGCDGITPSGSLGEYQTLTPGERSRVVEVAVAAAPENFSLDKALPLYRDLHPLLRWDSKPEFVQAIKYSMDLAGRKGGACRTPRMPLTDQVQAEVREATEKALAAGYR